jgi:beta-xylosidase
MGGDVLAFADPAVLVEGGTAYAYSTNSISPPINLQVSTSTDLHTWSPVREAMPADPPWAWPIEEGGEYWAPTVHRLGDRYLLYYAAHHRLAPVDRPGWCIGYAEATSPAGPFTPGTVPLVCYVGAEDPISPMGLPLPVAEGGVIYPHVYQAPDGRRFLYFKAIGNRYQIWGVPLGGNGITVASSAFGLVDLPPTSLTWERTEERRPIAVVENPAMLHDPNGGETPFTLLYSGDDWRTSDYSTGLARCRTPLGPCTRVTTDGGWMVSQRGVGGPGGASPFVGFDGQPWLAYHAWRRGEPSWVGRRLHVEPLGWEGGEPVLLRRPTTGTFTVAAAPGQVTLAGTADDPDTHQQLVVGVRQVGGQQAEVQVAPDGTWSTVLPAAQGAQTYCAEVLPVDDGPGRTLTCRRVEVPPPPIVANAPPLPVGAAP